MKTGTHPLGRFPLEKGGDLPSAVLSYATYGTLNESGNNAVLLPTYYTGTHGSYAPWIGHNQTLDPRKWFIVSVDMLGNGCSTSPSTSNARDFPDTTILDNVTAQSHLLRELGVTSIAMVAGWSMGAMQALRWGAEQPIPVRAVLSVCGTLSCGSSNGVFLDGLLDILAARSGERDPAVLRAFGAVYAGWAYSSRVLAGEGLRDLGYADVEDMMDSWRQDHEKFHAGDLESMARTWRHSYSEVSEQEIQSILRRITARTIVMPGSTDAYFTARQAVEEARWIADVEVRELESELGHVAGRPGVRRTEGAAVEGALSDLLAGRH